MLLEPTTASNVATSKETATKKMQDMVTVSLVLYGETANKLARELQIYKGKATVPMTATFEIHDVEGRTKIYASFTGEAPKTEKSTEQKAKEALELEVESAQLRAELKGFME